MNSVSIAVKWAVWAVWPLEKFKKPKYGRGIPRNIPGWV